jgi:hypothetical protein
MTKKKEFYKSHKNSDFFILLNMSSNRLSVELVTGPLGQMEKSTCNYLQLSSEVDYSAEVWRKNNSIL